MNKLIEDLFAMFLVKNSVSDEDRAKAQFCFNAGMLAATVIATECKKADEFTMYSIMAAEIHQWNNELKKPPTVFG